MGPTRWGVLSALALVLALALPLMAVPATAAAAQGPAVPSTGLTVAATAPPPFNAPTLVGAVIIDDGAALGLVGYTGWFGVWTPATNETQIYSNQFYLVFFNLRTTGFQLVVTVTQNDHFVGNTTEYIAAVSEAALYVNLPSDTAWVDTNLTFSGTPAWHGQVATPVSFLPPSVANVGGLDLVALVIVSFMVLVGTAAFSVARWAVRRAGGWAPTFSLLVWGHVLLAGIAAVVFLDYQQIDQTFAGWSPLVYPWATFPLFFLSSLSLFNNAPYVQIQQGLATSSGEMGTRVWKLRAGPLPDGRVVFIGESWGQFWARFWGHHALLWDGNPETTPPFLSPVEVMPSPTVSPRERMRLQRQRRKYPLTAHPLFRFAVQNKQDDGLAYIAWTKTSEPVRISWPRLSFHKSVEVPAKYAPSPNGGTVLVQPSTTKQVLTWPHYVGDQKAAAVELEDKHFVFGAAVWAGFSTIKDLTRVLSKLGSELATLQAHKHNLVEDEVYSTLRTFYALIGRATSGISEDEAAAAAGETERLLRPNDADERSA